MGRQGECSRERVKDAILLFAADQKKHKRSEFIKELVEKREEFAKNTVYKYLEELVKDELMKMEPGSQEDSFRPDYSITESGLEKVGRIKFNDLIDSLDARWLKPLRNLIDRLLEEKKDPYRVFNELCFAFIGELPFAFSKSPDALDRIIALERRLRRRYARDLDACMERCMVDVVNYERQKACLDVCRDEIGRTFEEFYRNLQKKAKKFPFPQRMWMAEGYSEEEIEKMLDDIKKQERYREKS